MGILESVLSLVPTVGNFISQAMTNKQNLDLQKEEWSREDTSVQRKVNDLKMAGLNPVLAAGGGGEPTSLTTRLVAPQVDNNAVAKSLQAQVIKQQIGRTAADTKIAENNADISSLSAFLKRNSFEQELGALLSLYDKQKADAKASNFNAAEAQYNANIAEQNLEQAKIDTSVKAHDWNIINKTGALSNASGMIGQSLNMGAILAQGFNTLRAKAKER